MRSTPGRKRELSFHEALDVALSWDERRNAGKIHKPTIDREVAEIFGISPRMVRRCRSELRAFLPVRKERPHEAKGRVDFEARQLAKRLMTPERLAKGERVVIAGGGLVVEQDRTAEAAHMAARRVFGLTRPRWLAIRPQWTRMMQAGDRNWIDNQECFVWEPHLRGRQIKRITYDTGSPLED